MKNKKTKIKIFKLFSILIGTSCFLGLSLFSLTTIFNNQNQNNENQKIQIQKINLTLLDKKIPKYTYTKNLVNQNLFISTLSKLIFNLEPITFDLIQALSDNVQLELTCYFSSNEIMPIKLNLQIIDFQLNQLKNKIIIQNITILVNSVDINNRIEISGYCSVIK